MNLVLRSQDRAPMVQADWTGFRLFGGRPRPWSDYGGVRVTPIERFGEPPMQALDILLATPSGFKERRLIIVEGAGYGGDLAQRIVAFEHDVRAINDEEAGRFDRDPAPVVAARIKPMQLGWLDCIFEGLVWFWRRR